MEETNLSPNSVMNLIRRQRETEDEEYKNREDLNTIETNKMLAEVQSLRDQQTQIKENIKKNLQTIVANTNRLTKVIQNSEDKTPKLPVTHKFQQDAISFVSTAMNFVNNFPDVQKSVESKNDIDATKLCEEIKAYGESVNQELSRSKTRVNQVETLVANTEIIKNHCFHDEDDDDNANDQDLME